MLLLAMERLKTMLVSATDQLTPCCKCLLIMSLQVAKLSSPVPIVVTAWSMLGVALLQRCQLAMCALCPMVCLPPAMAWHQLMK